MKSSGKRALSFSIRLSIEYILPIHVSSGVMKSEMEGKLEKNDSRVFKNLQLLMAKRVVGINRFFRLNLKVGQRWLKMTCCHTKHNEISSGIEALLLEFVSELSYDWFNKQ
jgi:hypothetical protein